MDCRHPIYLPKQDETVRCGYCIPCLVKLRRDWTIRLSEEWKASSNAYFLTLTYSDDFLPIIDETGFATVCKADVQTFLRSVKDKSRVWNPVRKRMEYQTPRWFVVAEYGPRTERPHYHAIIFNVSPNVLRVLPELWAKGFCSIQRVTAKRIGYVAKYQITKSLVDTVTTDRIRPFRICTKSSGGLGKAWLTDEQKRAQRLQLTGTYRSPSIVASLPKYYADRIGFTGPEKEVIRGKLEKYIEEKYEASILALVKAGYESPSLELMYREELAIGRIMKKVIKGHVI